MFCRSDAAQYSHCDLRIPFLGATNKRAGLKTFPGAHKDRNPKYGLMQHARTWYTKKGIVTNIVIQCPVVDRCSCLCEVKLAINADQTIMYVTDEHTAENHAKEKDISRHLSYEAKVLTRQAVQLAPMQSAGSLMRNIQDSPTKQINYRGSTALRTLSKISYGRNADPLLPFSLTVWKLTTRWEA